MRNRTMLKQMELSTEKESLFRCCRRNALSLWRKVGEKACILVIADQDQVDFYFEKGGK